MDSSEKADRHTGSQVTEAPFYDVVALIASAGGHAPIECVLRALPRDFSVPMIVMQHLSQQVSEPLRAYRCALPFKVEWATTGAALAAGSVLVAPPRSFLEILPDGTCLVSACARGARDKPMDRLLQSLARSFAHRALGVVLSGMMDDGAHGARELHAAGGYVIVQDEAEYADMTHATIRSGAADLTLPVERIAAMLVELAAGTAVPRHVSELEAVEGLFAGEDRARASMRELNWSATPLGPVLDWPEALSMAVRNVMSSKVPSCIFWGPDFVQIYNEAFLPMLGQKPSPAGKPARLTWPELWSSMGPQLESVLQTGRAIFTEDQLFQAERHGAPEELYLTHSQSALHDTDGTIRGVLNTWTETTERVRACRRLALLADLAALKGGESAQLVAEHAVQMLANAPLDVAFGVLYLLDKARTRANLAACVGVSSGSAAAPHAFAVADAKAIWPLADVARQGGHHTLEDLASRLPGLHSGAWPEPASAATLLPLWSGTSGPVVGVIVLGLSPRLRFDPSYETFLGMIARHVSTALGEAEARRQERERTATLAELDRSKVEFFSKLSHEFRTPLTLLLAPLEEMLDRRRSLPPDLEGAIEAASRNGRRLLTLVNTLLDFSQAESQRQQAQLELTDLGALTLDIASAFRSAIEAGGLCFVVHCDRQMPQIWVDRQMWEKIVSNLLSNALKFTFEGTIWVSLEALRLHAQLVVKDTGVGIPEHELPHLFKRFHRVRGARARTTEGSGIGLWMVDDLAKRIGGQLVVRSEEHIGTSFKLWVPYKAARGGVKHAKPGSTLRGTGFAAPAASDAARWAADANPASGARHGVLDDVFGPPRPVAAAAPEDLPARILIVDDNADMREYLERLLTARWRVEVAADGLQAFDRALLSRPDVILADVMMPGLDGFGLLARTRAHPELRHTPVLLLSARTGEEAAIAGLVAGADDYIAKPFSPRELVARIAAVVDRARAEAGLRKSETELLARNHELERFNHVAVGRELRMIELKKQVNALRERLGEPPGFPLAFEDAEATRHV